MTTDMAMIAIENFLADKNIFLSESEKTQLERLLEDLRQTGYNDGFDNGYFSGYDAGYDFESTLVD